MLKRHLIQGLGLGWAAGLALSALLWMGLTAWNDRADEAGAAQTLPGPAEACMLCYGRPTPYPTYTPYPTLTPAVVWLLVTPTPVPTATPTPTPTPRPTATPTPAPTATPAPLKNAPGDGWVVYLPQGIKPAAKPTDGPFKDALLYWRGPDWQVGVLAGRPPDRVGGQWWNPPADPAGYWTIHADGATWAAREQAGHYVLVAARSGLEPNQILTIVTHFAREG